LAAHGGRLAASPSQRKLAAGAGAAGHALTSPRTRRAPSGSARSMVLVLNGCAPATANEMHACGEEQDRGRGWEETRFAVGAGSRGERRGAPGQDCWELFPELLGTAFDRELHRAVREQQVVEFEYLLGPHGRMG
jgi:hypothetical protein